MDTQGQRYEVFVQETAGEAFLDYGSVHAPDAELALLNARDVFARRPEATAMWVVPAQVIYSQTAEQLAAGEPDGASQAVGAAQAYHVFCKPKPAGTQTQVGVIEAGSPQQALQAGLQAFLGRFPKQAPPSVWWVFPASSVTASQPEDAASMYAPAREKGFRLSTDFHTHSTMRRLKKSEG